MSVIEFTLFWDNDEFDVVVDGLHADATISLRLEIGSQGYDLEADDFVRAIRGGDDGFSTTLPSRPTRADNFRVVEFRIDTPPPSPVIPPTTDEVWETVSFSYEQETGQFSDVFVDSDGNTTGRYWVNFFQYLAVFLLLVVFIRFVRRLWS